MLRSGKMRCNCRTLIEPPAGRETCCERCANAQGRGEHQRVFVRFERVDSPKHPKGVWLPTYQDHGLRRELRRPSRFTHADVVRKLFERSAENQDLESQNLLAIGVRDGKGAFWLRLNAEEFRRMCGG